MKHRKPKSLRRTLTRSMVIMQALVLLTFALVAAVQIMNLIVAEQVLDGSVVDDIARSVERTPDGALAVVPTKKLSGIAADYPDFWFFAADVDGTATEMGKIPDHIGLMADNLSRINLANIADVGNPNAPAAIIRQHVSDAGHLWIITGGGPKLGFGGIWIAVSNPFFLGLLGFLTIASILIIPFIVRRQLRGLELIAAEADTINVDQRGVRLTSTSVPTELHPLVSAINQALQRLDEGMERQHRFMADAAHELRTPIAILQTRLELLPETEERRLLLLDAARLGSMANQLLDLQRMDLSPQPFEKLDLVELASQVTSDLAPLAIAAGDEVSFEAEAKSVMVMGDSGALSRAITNLIQNAIAHGGQDIDIAVNVGSDGRLSVTDTGPGIDQEHRAEIFEPFHRVAPLQHGAGLGLNLVRDIVRRHNGHVSVSGIEGGGAVFEIALPLAGEPSKALASA
ncbi:HAMP domain-containing sensor histidine kinase [Devosia sp. 2618]|uniref:sensor histidine kinase n=1 Tax=Devosia sp. 2618 TaxID=3156454 RepID=UPI0033964CDA